MKVVSPSAEDEETWSKNLMLLSSQQLSGVSGPEGNSIRTGVFVENLNADNNYISWGLFEDLIINSQFGFGEDKLDIDSGQNGQVKMNSSNAFTKWTSIASEKQHVLMQVPEDVPTFMFPAWWYNNGGDDDGSYSYQKGKIPEIFDKDGVKEELSTEDDKVKKRTSSKTLKRYQYCALFFLAALISPYHY